MKSKFGLVSVMFAAASTLFGSAEASANDGSWWGRAGYGCEGATAEVRACIDDQTQQMRVVFRVLGATRYRSFPQFDVDATIFGNALCDDECGDDDLHGGWQRSDNYLGYGSRLSRMYNNYGRYNDRDIVPIDGFRTDREIAYPIGGNWFMANFDLDELGGAVCRDGFMRDVYVDRAAVMIEGRRFYLDSSDLSICATERYRDVNDGDINVHVIQNNYNTGRDYDDDQDYDD
ncbi:MAG TPA: hypothetical protein PKA58_19165, partial [Polyangium sp.]|nr:hypothetical protein [Polyangium sp.]